ncbi:MAG: AraC family transcriptional regulator [Defluviitaleaceae bacterium]|nr:AraC family transcriptional regulator [Defluviitaleaceae bacterium]
MKEGFYMEMIQQILMVFYHCTGISIQFIDEELVHVASVGPIWAQSVSVVSEGIHEILVPKEVTTPSHVHHLIYPFDRSKEPKGYFVAGPYQNESEKEPFPFKPWQANIYFKDILDMIVDRHLIDEKHKNPYIAKGIEYIQAHYAQSISLQDMSNELNLNLYYFCSLFKSETGLNFNQYLNQLRIDKSKALLVRTQDSIVDIAMAVGFNNHTYFSLTFKKLTGMTPTEYRKKHQK